MYQRKTLFFFFFRRWFSYATLLLSFKSQNHLHFTLKSRNKGSRNPYGLIPDNFLDVDSFPHSEDLN